MAGQECQHESGPLAILERYKAHLAPTAQGDVPKPFSWRVPELQEPVRCCFDRLGEVFEWQVREYRECTELGEPYYTPTLIMDPARSSGRIALDATSFTPEPEWAFGD